MKTINTILLVDDDPVANFNKRLVERRQVADEIKVLQNGEEAISYHKERVENSLSPAD